MSASEKLKALDERAWPGPWRVSETREDLIWLDDEHWDADQIAELAQARIAGIEDGEGRELFKVGKYDDAVLIAVVRSALSQIRAVVEAAEEADAYLDYEVDRLPTGQWIPASRNLKAAFAALDEALP